MQKKLVAAAVGAALVATAPVAGAMEAKLSGQLNRAMMWADDGTQSNSFFVDSTTYHSFVDLSASHEVSPALTVGLKYNLGLFQNESDGVSQGSRSTADVAKTRYADTYLKGAFGKVSLGHGDSASAYFTEYDFTDSWLAIYSSATDFGGSLKFRDSTGALSSVTPYGVVWELGGVYRTDRIKYDAPALGPVNLSISRGNSGNSPYTDIGANAKFEFGGHKLQAYLGHAIVDLETAAGNSKNTFGSVSYLTPVGVSLTVAASTLKYDDNSYDASWQYVKLGYDAGKHHIAVDMSEGEDQLGEAAAVKGTRGKENGVGYVYDLDKGIKTYVSYKIFKVDNHPTMTFDDLNIVTAGMYLVF
ncbi:MAG: porin [Gammaproteobacteria bacterium]|nr:porin [Gammaproteobacteria bacterium]